MNLDELERIESTIENLEDFYQAMVKDKVLPIPEHVNIHYLILTEYIMKLCEQITRDFGKPQK